tara:strand:- start:113 stop:409 length:297 start_codon:yes stop_codon:yes gene_type:complete
MDLLLFIRKGCCICDSLKDNLSKINVSNIQPDLSIKEIDIDRFDLYKDRFKKYDYEVPVIAIKNLNSGEIIELPRISPRLKDLQLENWLKKNINNLNV